MQVRSMLKRASRQSYVNFHFPHRYASIDVTIACVHPIDFLSLYLWSLWDEYLLVPALEPSSKPFNDASRGLFWKCIKLLSSLTFCTNHILHTIIQVKWNFDSFKSKRKCICSHTHAHVLDHHQSVEFMIMLIDTLPQCVQTRIFPLWHAKCCPYAHEASHITKIIGVYPFHAPISMQL